MDINETPAWQARHELRIAARDFMRSWANEIEGKVRTEALWQNMAPAFVRLREAVEAMLLLPGERGQEPCSETKDGAISEEWKSWYRRKHGESP